MPLQDEWFGTFKDPHEHARTRAAVTNANGQGKNGTKKAE
jgi:hypothetical protein